MEFKLFELRDRCTFIPLLCIKPQGCMTGLELHPFIAKMAHRFGYQGSHAVIAMHMAKPEFCKSDPYEWEDRTFKTAHKYVITHWEELKTGDVIDVQYILGETDKLCESEA